MKAQSQREVFIDYIRVIAILFVVLCHTVEAVYSWDNDILAGLSDRTHLFRIAAFTCGRMYGVPFFLMITGYLLLDRTYDEKAIKKFYLNRWSHLIVCTIIWFTFYDLFVKYYIKDSLSMGVLLKDIFFLHNGKLGHQWYMPVIIGYYAMIPFFSIIFKKDEVVKYIIIPYLMVFLYASIVPFINKVLSIYGIENFKSQINCGFTGEIYGLYIVMGLLIKKGYLKAFNTVPLVLTAITSTLFLIGFTYIFYRNSYNIWYDSPFVIISSISIFEVSSRLKKLRNNNVIILMANYSFAVYLIHWLIRDLNIVRNVITPFRRPIQVIVLEIILVTCSYLVAWIISKIPKIGKLVLYVK